MSCPSVRLSVCFLAVPSLSRAAPGLYFSKVPITAGADALPQLAARLGAPGPRRRLASRSPAKTAASRRRDGGPAPPRRAVPRPRHVPQALRLGGDSARAMIPRREARLPPRVPGSPR